MVRTKSAKAVQVLGLVVAGLGVLIEYLTGVPGFPPVPPGPFILAGTALVVAVLRWRWIPALGLAVAAFIAVGAVVSGRTADVLAAPQVVGQFAGAVVQVVGLVVALVAGIAALRPARTSAGRA